MAAEGLASSRWPLADRRRTGRAGPLQLPLPLGTRGAEPGGVGAGEVELRPELRTEVWREEQGRPAARPRSPARGGEGLLSGPGAPCGCCWDAVGGAGRAVGWRGGSEATSGVPGGRPCPGVALRRGPAACTAPFSLERRSWLPSRETGREVLVGIPPGVLSACPGTEGSVRGARLAPGWERPGKGTGLHSPCREGATRQRQTGWRQGGGRGAGAGRSSGVCSVPNLLLCFCNGCACPQCSAAGRDP